MTMKQIAIEAAAVFLLLLMLPFSSASPLTPDIGVGFDQVIINSQDWEDMYHGLLFAALTQTPVDLIATPQSALAVTAALDKKAPRVLVLEPRRQRQYIGVQRLLHDQGLIPISLPGTGSIGVQFAQGLPLEQLIITDSRYPYNAIAVAPYAIQQRAFVLFADDVPLEELVSLVSEHNLSVTIYGIVDAAVTDALAPYDPLVIDEGGKFENNIHVVELFYERSAGDQVVLTNGEFLEAGLIDSDVPVLFIGRTNVPQQVEEYLATSGISTAVLVGNYLGDVASRLKKRLKDEYGKDLFVVAKVGRTPRLVTQQFATPVALEYVPLPIIVPEMEIDSMNYNRLTNQLEVTYDNPSLIPVFFLGSFALQSGDERLSVGDEEPRLIAAGQRKTVLYDAAIAPEGLRADAVVLFGDYPRALENSLRQTFEVIPVIEIPDYAELEVRGMVYDRVDDAFYISLHNPGDVPTYANVELIDVVVDGLPVTLGTQRTSLLAPGATKEVYVRAELSKLDLLENEEVLVRAFYGQREQVLFKSVEEVFPLRTRLIKGAYLVGGVVVVALVLLIFLLFGGKRTYVCDRCGVRVRTKRRPRRHHCGGRFRRK
ncbi:hypothetical protein GF367_03025 [Candidatus Woesearchaeota archaeon]|nr:hypothetical protein [Candidatus Woesearchaeota archaeon]